VYHLTRSNDDFNNIELTKTSNYINFESEICFIAADFPVDKEKQTREKASDLKLRLRSESSVERI
jgi:hypothetical protein